MGGLVALLLIVGAAAFTRPLWSPALPEGVLIEVEGEVPRPGTYLVDPPTVAGAIQAAGGTEVEGGERAVPPGHRVVVAGTRAAIEAPSDPLLVALPVDVNTATEEGLAAIPGVSRSKAEAIVADRAARGPFYALEDLSRVSGIGSRAVDELRPFATVGEPGERPPPPRIDLNRASATELEGLPGIGPVTAARIVVWREDRGPFRDVEELQEVRGIGPATMDRIRDRVVVE